MKLKLLTAAMLAMAIAPMQANAAATTTTINVTAAVVAPTASVLAAGSLAFGIVVQGSTGAAATTSFDVTVTNGVPYTVELFGTQPPVGTSFTMADLVGNTLNFNLYKDATKTVAYTPSTTASPVTSITGSGTGIAQTYTLYAETLQAGVAANYSDTLFITVIY